MVYSKYPIKDKLQSGTNHLSKVKDFLDLSCRSEEEIKKILSLQCIS